MWNHALQGTTTSLPTQRLKLIALENISKTWRFICRTDQNRAAFETKLVLTVSRVSGVLIAVRSKATTCRRSTQLRCSWKLPGLWNKPNVCVYLLGHSLLRYWTLCLFHDHVLSLCGPRLPSRQTLDRAMEETNVTEVKLKMGIFLFFIYF